MLIDDSSIQIRINPKLLARQRIQREPSRYFRNTNSAVVDHDVLDNDQNQENHDADGVITTDDELAKRADDIAGSGHPSTTVEQNEPCGSDIQRQPEQRRHQKN